MKTFEELSKIDVSKYVESHYKNQKIKYLSWANAYKLALIEDPKFSYELLRFDGKPYLYDEILDVCFVEVSCTMFELTKTMMLPVLDNSHKSVSKDRLNSFLINTAHQRCLVKCIALFGLGISLYAGEDTDMYTKEPKKPEENNQDLGIEKLKNFRVTLTGALAKYPKLATHNIDSLNNQCFAIFKQKPEVWTADNLQSTLDKINEKIGDK